MEQTFYSIHDYYISHHGVKGQKWGIRRYQNPDGTLTKEGKERYASAKERWSDKETLKRYRKESRQRNVSLLASLGAFTFGSFVNPVAGAVAGGAIFANAIGNRLVSGIKTTEDYSIAKAVGDDVLKTRIEDMSSYSRSKKVVKELKAEEKTMRNR